MRMRGKQPPNHLALSVVALVCSLPLLCLFGAIGLYFSSQVTARWNAGDVEGAQKASNVALIEVFSPGFAVHGRAREASLQVSAVSRPSAECLLAAACSEGPRWKSLTTRCRPGQRRRPQPSTGTDSL